MHGMETPDTSQTPYAPQAPDTPEAFAPHFPDSPQAPALAQGVGAPCIAAASLAVPTAETCHETSGASESVPVWQSFALASQAPANVAATQVSLASGCEALWEKAEGIMR